MKHPTCPVCGSNEHCRFVFAYCIDERGEEVPNQTDFDSIFVCPALHMSDEDGRIIRQINEKEEVEV